LVIGEEARILLLLRHFRDAADLKHAAQGDTRNPFIRHAHVFCSQVMKVVIQVPAKRGGCCPQWLDNPNQ
jgi:hypothetical protein